MSLQQIQVSVGGLRSGTGYLVPQGFHRFDAQDEKLAMLAAPQSRFSGMICRLEFRTSLEVEVGLVGCARPSMSRVVEPLAMPADDRLWSLDDRHRASFAPDFGKKRPQQGVE